jgi:glycerol-3-phosphate dehydrogenase
LVRNPNSNQSSSDLSRKHLIEVSPSNLISLMGGKWTICRLMGEETVDKVIEILKSKISYIFFNILKKKE